MSIKEIQGKILNGTAVPLVELDLSARVIKLLDAFGYDTVQKVAAVSPEKLNSISGFGRKSCKDLEAVLTTVGLRAPLVNKDLLALTKKLSTNENCLISELPFGAKITQEIFLSGILTTRELLLYSEKELIQNKGLSVYSVTFIRNVLYNCNLELRSNAAPSTDKVEKTVDKPKAPILFITQLPFSITVTTQLKRAGINYIHELEAMSVIDLEKFPFITSQDTAEIEKVLNEAGYFLRKASSGLVAAFREGMKQVVEESKAVKNQSIFPSPENIACDFLVSKGYIHSRKNDTNQLCADLLLGNVDYCKVLEYREDDGLHFSVVVGTKDTPPVFFASLHKECILAFILAKWW